jgi:hypothetical protein
MEFGVVNYGVVASSCFALKTIQALFFVDHHMPIPHARTNNTQRTCTKTGTVSSSNLMLYFPFSFVLLELQDPLTHLPFAKSGLLPASTHGARLKRS